MKPKDRYKMLAQGAQERAIRDVTGPVCLALIADLFALVEAHDQRVVALGMSKRVAAVLLPAKGHAFEEEVDPHKVACGVFGTLWGAQLYTISPSEIGNDKVVLADEYGGTWAYRLANLRGECPRCGGSGSIGYTMYVRCPMC